MYSSSRGREHWIHTTGVGASGSFKVNKEKTEKKAAKGAVSAKKKPTDKPTNKAKKPAVKKVPAKEKFRPVSPHRKQRNRHLRKFPAPRSRRLPFLRRVQRRSRRLRIRRRPRLRIRNQRSRKSARSEKPTFNRTAQL